MTVGTGTACAIEVDRGSPEKIWIGPPYNAVDALPPDNLRMLLGLIDKSRWPLQICGDSGVGINAPAYTVCDTVGETRTDLDLEPPLAEGIPTLTQEYGGMGVTAYGCQLNCNYIISGTLGADVIIGKIDNQWHIIKVNGTAQPEGQMFTPSNDCRCCGNTWASMKLRARIVNIFPSLDCGPYRLCHEFRIDPISNRAGLNPLGITIGCQSASLTTDLENKADWTAFACGEQVEVLDVKCCITPSDCISGTGSVGTSEEETGTGTGTETVCRTEVVIRVGPVPGCSECTYDIMIYAHPDDNSPCERFIDQDIETVTAEACGLPDLRAGDRVILAKIPGGLPGREALGTGTTNPVEWFVIRACTSRDCANPCDPVTPEGPPCCGKYCSEMPQILNVTVEMLAGDLSGYDGPYTFQISKWNGSLTGCNGAADTRWSLVTPIPDGTIWPGFTTDPEPGPYPTWLDIEVLELICGGVSAEESCGNGTGSPAVAGPSFGFSVGGGLVPGGVDPLTITQDLSVACCEPLYLEYTVTGVPMGMAAGAGTQPALVTLKFTIFE